VLSAGWDLCSALHELVTHDLLVLPTRGIADGVPKEQGTPESSPLPTSAGLAVDGSLSCLDDVHDDPLNCSSRLYLQPDTSLLHSFTSCDGLFVPRLPTSQPMLWNLFPTVQGDMAGSAVASHRRGCLPSPLLIVCPAVASILVEQASSSPLISDQFGAKAELTAAGDLSIVEHHPVQGVTLVEAALLAEAALLPTWGLGPTDASLMARRCKLVSSLGTSAIGIQCKVCWWFPVRAESVQQHCFPTL
jgi:hypothetical protein